MTRPDITLTWAQSLDGAIAQQRGRPTPLSGPASLVMTHRLRAEHDAILVGIDTVIADDPSLTVRHVAGPDPQPVVVDSRLRCPVGARLLARRPWLVTTVAAATRPDLTAAGADIVTVSAAPDGRVALPALVAALHARGVRRLLVEGGARIHTSFLSAGLFDRVVVTIAPLLLDGYPVVSGLAGPLRLRPQAVEQVGDDIVLTAVPA